ncbi:uncharacterized protein SPPG_01966 [Spizellomyces punctatus DAOM BR117]|uniref:WAC domain-containing protein n=1 Tax=Spizellomyces punctatus (strain DAOM BR117) TaxID=645134 RepID=A0A0L0HPJ0_SPIPD|nr:uncharacterized protein SPPG_01966 [Spizellomyces punctatus DAOM BR117]KND02885.1 hypothetical protein SPPG_01966 [Spizellomyces punctatus DAOM BR117]|eukprot:XP_016610924.1 hypothetical protein SPPG_01966 [Spizellomyces punctatus DAOM BR117]
MPLHKRKPVEILPLPTLPEGDGEEVWQVRTTGEIFQNYEDYVARYNFLRKKQFACAKTGRSNLTYEDALISEQEATRRVEENFPEVWRRPAMEIIHYSMEKLNSLVDHLYDFFKDRIFVGEYIYIDVEGTLALAKVLEEIRNVRDGNGFVYTNGANDKGVDVEGNDKSGYRYRVNLVDDQYELLSMEDMDGDLAVEYELPASQLKRDRQILSKQNFKKFIRDVATKDMWVGAPWTVRSEFLKRYSVPDTPPPAVRELLDERHRKLTGDTKPVHKKKAADNGGTDKGSPRKGKQRANDDSELDDDLKKKGRSRKSSTSKRGETPPKSKAKPLRFPMEDLELLKLAPRPKSLGIPDRPEPSRDFGEIPEHLTTALMEVWTFLAVYGKPLQLYPFTLDEFIKSLSHQAAHPRAVLIHEAFGSLLAVACQEWSNKLDASATHVIPIPDFASIDPTKATPGELFLLDKREAVEQYKAVYQALTDDEKAALDQWWKWEPGRWSTGYESQKVNAYGSGKQGPGAGRLKAWEIVLAGVVRDWLQLERFPRKWAIVSHLLGGLRQQEDQVDVTDEQDDIAMEEEDIDINGSATPERNVTPMETDNDEEDVPRPFGLRKRRRKDDEDDDFVFDKKEEQGSTRSKRRARQPVDTIPANGSRSKTRAAAKAKADAALAFDRLCQSTESGFLSLSCNDRLELLSFLVRDCVGQSSLIRGYVDECIEKSFELKKEKREIAKERKDLLIMRAEFESRDRGDSPLNDGENGVVASALIGASEGQEVIDDAGNSSSNSSDEESPRASRSRHTSRVQKLREEQARREEEDRRRRQEYEQMRRHSRARQKEQRARAEERKKIEEQERVLARRELTVDYQLRVLTAASRLKPLGRDRYWNRYWWFDPSLGSSFETDANNAKSKTRARGGQAQSGQLDWVSGRLFVEDVGLEPRTILQDDEQDVVKQGLTHGVWGFYSEPHQIEQLLTWLDPRGVRELSLKTTVERLAEHITAGMQRRNEDITAAIARQEVMSSRRPTRSTRTSVGGTDNDGADGEGLIWESYLDYTNRWAK